MKWGHNSHPRRKLWPYRKALWFNCCSNISACSNTCMLCGESISQQTKKQDHKDTFEPEMIFRQPWLVGENPRPLLSTQPPSFLFEHLVAVLLLGSWNCRHPAADVMYKRSHIWLPTLSIPDVGKWQAFLPEWFVVGASLTPVFSADPCWDSSPHLRRAVFCVSAHLIYGAAGWMKNCVTGERMRARWEICNTAVRYSHYLLWNVFTLDSLLHITFGFNHLQVPSIQRISGCFLTRLFMPFQPLFTKH